MAPPSGRVPSWWSEPARSARPPPTSPGEASNPSSGYERVPSAATALAVNREAAERVEPTLPETGVCGGTGLYDEPDAGPLSGQGGGCCATPEPITLGATPSRPVLEST